MLGRGISLIALPLALGLMVLWRISIHWLLGHPDFGERILIVGSGNLAVEVAREVLNRPDAGYRIVGFVGTDADLLGKSLINPRVIGMTEQLDEIVKRENIDRIVVGRAARPTAHQQVVAVEPGGRGDDRGGFVLRARHRSRL